MIDLNRLYAPGESVDAAVYCHTAALSWWAYTPSGFTDEQMVTDVGFIDVERVVVDAGLSLQFIRVGDDHGLEIAFAGTETLGQWIDYVIRSGFVAATGIIGQVFRPFDQWSELFLAQIRPLLNATIPIVLTGHSLGGAMAVLCAEKLRVLGYNVRVVHTFGCPKIGDDAFIQGCRVQNHHYIGWADPVPALPPRSLTSGGPFDQLGLLVPFAFRPPEDWYEQSSGRDSFNPLAFLNTYALISSAISLNTFQLTRHNISTYLVKFWPHLKQFDLDQLASFSIAIKKRWGIDVLQ